MEFPGDAAKAPLIARPRALVIFSWLLTVGMLYGGMPKGGLAFMLFGFPSAFLAIWIGVTAQVSGFHRYPPKVGWAFLFLTNFWALNADVSIRMMRRGLSVPLLVAVGSFFM